MATGAIEIALKDVVELKIATLREEIAYCELMGQPIDDLEQQVRLIERLRGMAQWTATCPHCLRHV